MPGMVASEDCDNSSWPFEQSYLGQQHSSVVVPKGRWLAKGEIRSCRCRICTSALMSFERRSDLPAGAMNVYQRQDEDNPTFVVQLGEDVLLADRKTSRDVWIAGLVAVCSKLPRSTFRERYRTALGSRDSSTLERETSASQRAGLVRRRLEPCTSSHCLGAFLARTQGRLR